MPLTAPVPEEYARKFDKKNPSTYGANQVATGPYMIENDASGKAIGYEPGRRINLVRNPNWDKALDFKPAYLDQIDMPQGNDDTTVAVAQDPQRPEHDQRRRHPRRGHPQAGRHAAEGSAHAHAGGWSALRLA